MRIYRQPSKQKGKDKNPCFEIASRAGFIVIFNEGSCEVFKKFSYSWLKIGSVVLPLISQAQVMNPVTPDLLFGMSSAIPAPLFGVGWQWWYRRSRVAVPKCH